MPKQTRIHSRGKPRGAQNRSREAPGATKIDSEVPPEVEKADFCCAPRSRTVFELFFRQCLSIFRFCAKCANPPKYRACRSKSRLGPLRCELRRSRNIALKSDEGPAWATFSVDFCRSRRPSRPTRSTFVARSASVERLGSTQGEFGPPGRARWFKLGLSIFG